MTDDLATDPLYEEKITASDMERIPIGHSSSDGGGSRSGVADAANSAGGGGGSGSGGGGPCFIVSKYGTKQIMLRQHTFNRHISREDVTYWRCSQFAVLRCRARLKTKGDTLTILNSEHNHEVITKARKYGSLKKLKAAEAAAKLTTTLTEDPETTKTTTELVTERASTATVTATALDKTSKPETHTKRISD